jgi:hypothetical protein
MPRISGVLGERVLRKIIGQLSDSITKNTQPAERRKLLEKILSLRDELHANSLIHKRRREKQKERQTARLNAQPPQESPQTEGKSEIEGKS